MTVICDIIGDRCRSTDGLNEEEQEVVSSIRSIDLVLHDRCWLLLLLAGIIVVTVTSFDENTCYECQQGHDICLKCCFLFDAPCTCTNKNK